VKKGLQGEEECVVRKGIGAEEKAGPIFRPARGSEGDGGSKGSDCAVRRDFPGVKWREGTGTLWRPSACYTENRVAGAHIVAGLGCEGPSIGYRQLARPCGPRSGGDYGVRLGVETRGGCGSINHGDLLRARDVGEAGGLEGDCKRNGYRPRNVVSASGPSSAPEGTGGNAPV
jgi:hypothetical protein